MRGTPGAISPVSYTHLDVYKRQELTEWISALAKARAESPALRWGSYHNVMVQPRQLIFELSLIHI